MILHEGDEFSYSVCSLTSSKLAVWSRFLRCSREIGRVTIEVCRWPLQTVNFSVTDSIAALKASISRRLGIEVRRLFTLDGPCGRNAAMIAVERWAATVCALCYGCLRDKRGNCLFTARDSHVLCVSGSVYGPSSQFSCR